MMITTPEEVETNKKNALNEVREGDCIDGAKLNALPGPLIVLFVGDKDSGWGLESVCVETGVVRYNVCGLIDHDHFSCVKKIIDADGNEHDPDDFWL